MTTDNDNRAREILLDVVGLRIDQDTATITMTPDSFYRCIRLALEQQSEAT